jgi:hypothetical protein
MSIPSPTTRVASPGLSRAAVSGTVTALLLVASLYAVARLTGDPLLVEPPGQSVGPAPLPLAMIGTVVGGGVAWVGALVARRTRRPRAVLAAAAAAACLVSFAAPIGASVTASTAVWLCAMHVAVVVGVVSPLARALPAVSR